MQRRRRRQRERQKTNRLSMIDKITTLHVHHAFYVHFLAVVARPQRE